MKNIIVALLFIVCGCNDGKNKSSQNENTPNYTPSKPIEQKKSVKKFRVKAEVFHYIDNYDGTHIVKDANRKEEIEIVIYEDGSMYCSQGMPPYVRYTDISGYEYECNRNNDIWAFNQSDMILKN